MNLPPPPTIGSLEITKYRYESLNECDMTFTMPKIVIEQIRVLDTSGNLIKIAQLKEVVPFLSKYPVRFI